MNITQFAATMDRLKAAATVPPIDEWVREVLEAMPKEWAEHWCSAGMCACLGCCNRGVFREFEVSIEQYARVAKSMGLEPRRGTKAL